MRVFISADLEGISGVVHAEHTRRDGREHDLARRLMTAEVNAAIEGALAGGAGEVVVNDSHGTMRNLLPDLLHPKAQLITGSPKPLSMMEGIDDGAYCCAMFVGYHARMGQPGPQPHLPRSGGAGGAPQRPGHGRDGYQRRFGGLFWRPGDPGDG